MERIEERLDQFLDPLANRMHDMMNTRRRRDRNSRRSKGEESENSFFDGDGSSSDEQLDRPRRNHREDNRRWESGMRVNIPEFDGDTLNPEGFIDWLVAVEQVFEFKEVPENKKSECKKTGKKTLFAEPEEWEDDGVANDDYKEALIFDDDQYEEEVVSGDVGVNLMVCIFVVDPGSCDNLIAEDAVEKLGLKTKNRHKHYKLQWLKKGIEVTVSKRVLVTFSLGTTYKDSVWCDKVPIDTYRLLLGRPWEYDRNKTHNGRANTYSFLFGGVKITLMPNNTKELVNKPTCTLLTLSQFEDELEMGDEVHRAVHDNLHLLPYHGDSSDDDLVVNSRENFVYPRGNDAGPKTPFQAQDQSIRSLERGERHDLICYLVYFTTSVGIRAEVPVKMPPRRNRPLTEAYEQEFEQRVMARMEERLDQFVDQLVDRMNDMMNPRRRRDRNSRESKGEES
ncbi:hypothetical protein Tco_0404045 [Tanacetum coccineum]